MSVDFKGSHYPKSVILYAVLFYVCCVVSHRDLEEIMTERGVSVDHPTPNRWVVKYSPQITRNAQRKLPTANSWWMDETYVKVRGRWMYLYHAVDRTGQTIDFMHSARRNREATKRFLKRAIEANPAPNRIAIDKSGANHAGIQAINNVRKLQASCHQIQPFQSKYLNNIVE